jgi:REP element-mobilizing transposase RayT
MNPANINRKVLHPFMSTHTQLLYHIVFGTKYRIPCLQKNKRQVLYKYIWGILNNNKCHLYRINGVEDHLHILTHIHPTVALSLLIKDIKLASHTFIKQEKLFPPYRGWQEGYGAFTHHFNDKNRLIGYIKTQESHHRYVSWPEELKALLKEHEIAFDERYLL